MTDIKPTPKKPSPPSQTDLLDATIRQVKKELNCVKIGVIQSFDADKQEVTVKIAQTQVTSIDKDGTRTLADYPLLMRCPVFFPSGGGLTLTFPIAAGDECIVLFNDRQLDNWLTSGAGLPPTIGRLHDISDGIALVGLRSNPRALNDVSTTDVELRNDEGTVKFSFGAGGAVNIIAPGGVNIVAPQVTVTGDVIAGSMSETISLLDHIHSGVVPGGGNTGEPVP